MQAPSATFIEAAIDSLKDPMYLDMNHEMLTLQKTEYFSALPKSTVEEYNAYAVGVEVCRILLLSMPNAVKNHISL